MTDLVNQEWECGGEWVALRRPAVLYSKTRYGRRQGRNLRTLSTTLATNLIQSTCDTSHYHSHFNSVQQITGGYDFFHRLIISATNDFYLNSTEGTILERLVGRLKETPPEGEVQAPYLWVD